MDPRELPCLPLREGRLPPCDWYPAGVPGVESGFLTLSGGERVRVARAGAEGAPPVVLLHGWACSIYSWRNQLPALAAAGFRAIAVELRGHGLSDHPTDGERYTGEAMTAFLEEVLDALELERVALVGHSLGAGIAVRLALRQPGRVAWLAAISGVGFGRTTVIPLLARLPDPLVRGLLPLGSARALFRTVLRMVAGGPGRYDERDVDEYWAATQFPGFLLVLWRLVQRYRWDELTEGERARLREGEGTRLLMVYGERDRLVRRSAGREEGSGGTHAREVVLDAVGHAAHEESPAVINALLLSFLAPWRAEGAHDRDPRPAAGGSAHADGSQ